MDDDVVHPGSGMNVGRMPRLMRVRGEVLCRACAFAKYPDGASWTMVQADPPKVDPLTEALFGDAPVSTAKRRKPPRPSEARPPRGATRPSALSAKPSDRPAQEIRQKPPGGRGGRRRDELVCHRKKAAAAASAPSKPKPPKKWTDRPSVLIGTAVLTPAQAKRQWEALEKARLKAMWADVRKRKKEEKALTRKAAAKAKEQAEIAKWACPEHLVGSVAFVGGKKRWAPAQDPAEVIRLAGPEQEGEMFPKPLRKAPLPMVTGGTSHASAPSILLKEIDVVAEVLAMAEEKVIDLQEMLATSQKAYRSPMLLMETNPTMRLKQVRWSEDGSASGWEVYKAYCVEAAAADETMLFSMVP
ncbi:hypothetical protein EPO34_03985 [Patescibacteria group bacterium]|nr:MAG: hypothetical protein EPO34_03985 [Patescibacteria group bacterium]